MPLETGTTISNLEPSNPATNDPKHQGDDHIRLIKSVLQAQFPDGAGGSGFTQAITATSTELNRVSGASSNLQDQIDANTDTNTSQASRINSNENDIFNLQQDIYILEVPAVQVTAHIVGATGSAVNVSSINNDIFPTRISTGVYNCTLGNPISNFKVQTSADNCLVFVQVTGAQTFTLRTYSINGVLTDSPLIHVMVSK